MSIKDDLSWYEATGAPTASAGQYESEPAQRRQVTNTRRRLPSGTRAAVPPETWSEDGTPVYWQTVQAMASRAWRREA